MNETSDSENRTTVPDRERPPSDLRLLALVYAVVVAIAAAWASANLFDGSFGQETEVWLPASVLLTADFLLATTGVALLWRSTGPRAATMLYCFCFALGVSAAVPFFRLPIIAAGVAIAVAGPAVAVLVMVVRTGSRPRWRQARDDDRAFRTQPGLRTER